MHGGKDSITFLMPGTCQKPVGGTKIVLEYANRLAKIDYEVHIVYPASIFFKKESFFRKIVSISRYFRHYRNYSARKWFILDETIKEHFVYSLNYKHVVRTNKYMATGVQTAYYLAEYPIPNDKKFYIIQDYETWAMTEEDVRRSYHFPHTKIVISNWLKEIVDKENSLCYLVPNGFDFSQFYLTIEIEKKNKYMVSMQYHIRPAKGIEEGFEVLKKVKKQIPQLEVNLFGIYYPKESLPDWIHFFFNPDIDFHNHINNISAIYIGTSKLEGWGLTVGEAMMCGQAVVCTDNQGYREMAIDGETALLSPVDDIDNLSNNVIKLINDDKLRYKIAYNGYNMIKKFSIESSFALFKSILD